jgi:hypothetical protein
MESLSQDAALFQGQFVMARLVALLAPFHLNITKLLFPSSWIQTHAKGYPTFFSSSSITFVAIIEIVKQTN